MKTRMKVYLDFDGTVVEHRYPLIGSPVVGAVEGVALLRTLGCEIVLNAYRANLSAAHLADAVAYCESVGIVLDGVLSAKVDPVWDLNEAAITGILFIDDIADGIPLTGERSKVVDWAEVMRQIALWEDFEVRHALCSLERAIEVGSENWKGIDGVSYIRELRGSNDED